MCKNSIIVLCGGRGTRLKDVWTKPKILAPIADRTYLEILIELLDNHNKKMDITLAIGHNSQDICDFVSQHKLPVKLLNEDHELGTGGAVLNYIDQIKPSRFSVMNGDTLYTKNDLRSFLKLSDEINKNIISAINISKNDRYGSIELGDSLRIFKPNKPVYNDTVFAGIATLNTEQIAYNSKRPISIEQLLNLSAISSSNVMVHSLDNIFYDIGTPESLKGANAWLKSVL